VTVRTAGEALNYHPYLHVLLADGYWKEGPFTRFYELGLKASDRAFAERVLAQLHKQELLAGDDVPQVRSSDHTGFGVLIWDPFHHKESKQLVARYTWRSPVSLELLLIQHNIATHATKDGAAHGFDALEFVAALSCHVPKASSTSRISKRVSNDSCLGLCVPLGPLWLQPKSHNSR